MPKTSEPPKTIDEYIEKFPKDIQDKLRELRKVIKETAPEVTETISYQMPTFKLYDRYLVYFSANKKHIGCYPFPSGIEAFKKESSDYSTSKGTIRFPYDKPIPFDLVRKIVKYRAEENLKLQKKGK